MISYVLSLTGSKHSVGIILCLFGEHREYFTFLLGDKEYCVLPAIIENSPGNKITSNLIT